VAGRKTFAGGAKMNIRIGEGAVRFRISTEELKLLLAGKKLEERLTLAGKPVLLAIDPFGGDKALELLYRRGHIGLKVSPDSLQELDQGGRSKEGISAATDGGTLSLQVDLKTYARQKAS
jgi:hypothetical protein